MLGPTVLGWTVLGPTVLGPTVLGPTVLGGPRGRLGRGRLALLAVIVSGTGLLSGCGSAAGDEARSAASRFEAAIASRDGEAACALLAPATREDAESGGGRCAQAIPLDRLGAGGEVEGVEVFGSQGWAQAGSDTVFLGRVDGRWLVTAAGCQADPPGPYDCELSGS